MKKLLLGSATLILFSISMLIFQVSCKKDAIASPSSIVTQQNKIVYTRAGGGVLEIWKANYDGTNKQKINISLPTGRSVAGGAKLSPDGQTLFFQVSQSGYIAIYSCTIDGSDVTQVINESSASFEIEAVY